MRQDDDAAADQPSLDGSTDRGRHDACDERTDDEHERHEHEVVGDVGLQQEQGPAGRSVAMGGSALTSSPRTPTAMTPTRPRVAGRKEERHRRVPGGDVDGSCEQQPKDRQDRAPARIGSGPLLPGQSVRIVIRASDDD